MYTEINTMTDFQRIGALSNSHVGRDFEVVAKKVLTENGIIVSRDHAVRVGISKLRKTRRFDFGAEDPAVIVECKSHTWTSGGNVPSAKITVWNESMYYFSIAPQHYRKIFFVLRDMRITNGESLASYYLRTYPHLVPDGVESWEYDSGKGAASRLDTRQ